MRKLIPYSKVTFPPAASQTSSLLTIHIHQWGAASVVVYVPAVGLAKVAILLFYLRLNPDRGFRTAVYISLILTISYVIALSLAILFACQPVARFWNPFLEGHCLDARKLYLANAILNVIFDFVVLLVPVPMLRKLQVSTRQKLVIGALFSLGSVTCVVSVVRIYFQDSVLGEADLSWHIVTPTSLVFVECNLSIICGCVMVLRPFIRRYLPNFLGADYRRYKSPAGRGVNGVYDGQQGKGSGYKTRVSARDGKGSGAGRSWPSMGGLGMGSKNRSGSDDTVVDDVELGAWGRGEVVGQGGGKRGMGGLGMGGIGKGGEKNQVRSESEENIIQPVGIAVGDGRRGGDMAPGILKTIDVDIRRAGG